jgi:hypothetical protein
MVLKPFHRGRPSVEFGQTAQIPRNNSHVHLGERKKNETCLLTTVTSACTNHRTHVEAKRPECRSQSRNTSISLINTTKEKPRIIRK